jgi:hypothetical protein
VYIFGGYESRIVCVESYDHRDGKLYEGQEAEHTKNKKNVVCLL